MYNRSVQNGIEHCSAASCCSACAPVYHQDVHAIKSFPVWGTLVGQGKWAVGRDHYKTLWGDKKLRAWLVASEAKANLNMMQQAAR